MNLKEPPFSSAAICAGARNLSIIQAIVNLSSGIPLTHHFDEREAAFFALGTARRHNKPVAVVCTSGTAVTECFSALVESYYSAIPLVIISADRPRQYRKTGAPQSIEQNGIFLPYCDTQDIEVKDPFNLDCFSNVTINANGPTHLNFCISEFKDNPTNILPYIDQKENDQDKIRSFFDKSKNPVVILSGIKHEWRTPILNTLRNMNLAIFAESTSGLRESTILSSKSLKSGEKILQLGTSQNLIDGIIKIGSTPTARFFRDLEFFSGPCLSIDCKDFSGSPSAAHIKTDDIHKVLNLISIATNKYFLNRSLFDLDLELNKKLAKLLYEFPKSEPGLINRLSTLIHPHDQVFLGNSLPIRQWELVACRSISHELVFAQRGTNGIDGQISNFLGGLDSLRHNFGIFGDLTTIYGNNALWSLQFTKQFPTTIIVINNFGGQIFSRVPSVKKIANQYPDLINMITNPHNMELSHLAKFWNVEYSKVNACSEQLTGNIRAPGHRLIELIPDAQQTQIFWEKYDQS